jgi:hypothetical protein
VLNNFQASLTTTKLSNMATVQQIREPEKKKERPSALRSIIAGSTAGAVEIGKLTYYQ